MLSAVAVGALLAAIAAAMHPVVGRFRLPRRFLWLGTMVLALVLPAMLALRPAHPADRATPGVTTRESTEPSAVAAVAVSDSPNADRNLLGAWAAISGLLALLALPRQRRLRREVAALPFRTLCGTRIKVLPGFGPAVINVRHPVLVMPSWVLDLPEPEQRLIVRHEVQHVAARDQYLLLLSAVIVALMPWNPALWWTWRRLRSAIELDCDARVAPTAPERPRYARLLLDARDLARAHAPALGFSPATSALAERLTALLDRRQPPRWRLGASFATAIGCAALATRVPMPRVASAFATPPVSRGLAPVFVPAISTSSLTPQSDVAPGRVSAPALRHRVAAAYHDVRYDRLVPYTPPDPRAYRVAVRGTYTGASSRDSNPPIGDPMVYRRKTPADSAHER